MRARHEARAFDKKSRILQDQGGTTTQVIFGPHAEEVINVFALAIRTGATAADLKELSYAYPAGSSDITYMV